MNQLTDVIHLRSPYGAKSSDYEVEFDPELRVIWAFLNPRGNACFTPTLLAAIRNHSSRVHGIADGSPRVRFHLPPRPVEVVRPYSERPLSICLPGHFRWGNSPNFV